MRDVREIDCRLNFGRQQGAALLLLAPWGQDAVDECEVTDACDCCCCSLELFQLNMNNALKIKELGFTGRTCLPQRRV